MVSLAQTFIVLKNEKYFGLDQNTKIRPLLELTYCNIIPSFVGQAERNAALNSATWQQ
jgi:hypothetical protein